MNPIPMWIYTYPELKIVDVNDAAIQEYGYSRKEFLSHDNEGSSDLRVKYLNYWILLKMVILVVKTLEYGNTNVRMDPILKLKCIYIHLKTKVVYIK